MIIQSASNFAWSTNTQDLKRFMEDGAVDYLNEKTRGFILDYVNIKEGYRNQGIAHLTDYSYLIAPVFKALEGTLIQIAEDLAIDSGKASHKIGTVFSEFTFGLIWL